MKKWKWAAALLLGLPALGIGVLWIDAVSRAEDAIKAEEDRLARDIATFRARRKPPVPIPDFVTPGDLARLPCPSILYRNPQPVDFEDGRAGQILLGMLIWRQKAPTQQGFINMPMPPRRAVLPIDDAILALTATQALVPVRGYQGSIPAEDFEEEILGSLSRPLTRAEVPVEQIRTLAGALDRLLAGRPTIAETLEAEVLLDRSEILRIHHRKADPTEFLARGPGWREFFSWRIFVAKVLKDLDEEYRAALRLEAVKGYADVQAQDLAQRVTATSFPLTQSALLREAGARILRGRQLLTRWTLARVATAAALFQRETGREPTKLEELVPRYLPSVPDNPLGGPPIKLGEDAELRAFVPYTGQEFVWPLRRE